MKKRGFTLIELLVVIGIISVISGVVVVSTSPSRAKARDAKRLADFSQFEAALYNYYDSYGVYPCGDNQPYDDNGFGKTRSDRTTYDSSLSSPFLDGQRAGGSNGSLGSCKLVDGPTEGIFTLKYYPIEWPKDPINYSSYDWQNTSKNYAYGYDVSNDRQKYLLYARLEVNDALMKNDGGVCEFLFEQGPWLGTIPSLVPYVAEKCNNNN